MKMPLGEKIEKAISTTQDRLKILHEMGVNTAGDLLQYFPRAWEQTTQVQNLHELRADQKNVLTGTFSNLQMGKARTGIHLTKAVFTDQRGDCLECTWFNQPHLRNTLPLETPVMICGKAKIFRGQISMPSPTFEKLSGQLVHSREISPVYRESGKLSATWFRQKIFELFPQVEDFAEILPEEILKNEDLLPRHQAIGQMHFPENDAALQKAKRSLAFCELFCLQIAGLLRKQEWQRSVGESASKQIPLDPDLQKEFFSTLPFTLTGGQKVALFEILQDLAKAVPMLRLLEGDVGSGKTVVAAAASIPVLRANFQVAFLAPTEVLAQQHFQEISKLLGNFDPKISVALLTGSTAAKARAGILQDLRRGKVQVLVGTHALIQEDVVWKDLGFCVIDEQHRFGVRQRQVLLDQGAPHILQMTATPIPRTLAIVAFGDQDLSIIAEKPKGRQQIHTKVVGASERRQVELFIESEIAKGRQGFVICPLVEFSEKLEVKSAQDEFEKLRKVFPKMRLGLLHGRLAAGEKSEIFQQFQAGKIDLLVSTSVVEVGVNVPNATLMLIESAERFGLAQLHQFRGRVGRGQHKSHCFLFPTEGVGPTRRLRAMEKFDDGFRLAEIDLHLRGPGNIFGVAQSGLPDLKSVDLFDSRTIDAARKAAEDFLEQHHKLENFPPALRREVRALQEQAVSGV